MSVSGLNIYSSMYRNLIINRSAETEDEMKLKKLNNANPDMDPAHVDAQNAASLKATSTANRIHPVEEKETTGEEAQGVSLDVNYGAGQSIPVHTRNNTTPQDFTFDFSKKDDFQLVGARNKMEDVDIEKGISDMKKETVLDQYKYFINPSKLGSDQDGTVKIVGWD